MRRLISLFFLSLGLLLFLSPSSPSLTILVIVMKSVHLFVTNFYYWGSATSSFFPVNAIYIYKYIKELLTATDSDSSEKLILVLATLFYDGKCQWGTLCLASNVSKHLSMDKCSKLIIMYWIAVWNTSTCSCETPLGANPALTLHH